MTQFWLSAMPFPVVDRRLIGSDQFSGLGLEQAQIEPTLADVVTERNYLLRICLREWLGGGQAQMTTRQ
jgi:hypothetical protein